MLTIIISTVNYMLSTMVEYQDSLFVSVIEGLVISVFTFDYLATLILTKKPKLEWFLKPLHLIDLLAIFPFYIEEILDFSGVRLLLILRIFRLFRIFRMLKMAKYSKLVHILGYTLFSSAASFLLGLFFLVISCIILSTLTFYAETYYCYFDDYEQLWKYTSNGNPTVFQSVPDSMWYTLVTLCTVGYGDFYPVTPLGKLFGGLTILCAPFVLSYPMTILSDSYGTISNNFNNKIELKKQRKILFQNEQLMQIEARTPKELLIEMKNALKLFALKIQASRLQVNHLEKQFILLEEEIFKLKRLARRLDKVAKRRKKWKNKHIASFISQ
uniref:Ion transport domain-containing protein n=1 Tax=Arcella intermedia TaxID=1963864 RepID=A0A6B2L9H9_9EUKA